MKELIQKLKQTQSLTKEEWIRLIENRTPELAEYLFEQAREVREMYYGKDIYIRGLIEFTNYCKNDCLYCGIRRSNHCVSRYRLTEEEILELEKRYEEFLQKKWKNFKRKMNKLWTKKILNLFWNWLKNKRVCFILNKVQIY